ncbi:glyoxalase [Streptosporangium violaceochromogenes]|nr:glyoxalase [Streptosporangium violaceochromogenes]
MSIDHPAVGTTCERIRAERLRAHRPLSSARGLHHFALISSDIEATISFYQDLLEFPLTKILDNPGRRGSHHFFFDVGNGNLLAFFDFPDLDLGPYREVTGGLHHLAVSVDPSTWERLLSKLEAAGVPHRIENGASIHFRDPDGTRLELLADPLGEMYGAHLL